MDDLVAQLTLTFEEQKNLKRMLIAIQNRNKEECKNKKVKPIKIHKTKNGYKTGIYKEIRR